jgi:hypothetical protein
MIFTKATPWSFKKSRCHRDFFKFTMIPNMHYKTSNMDDKILLPIVVGLVVVGLA